jgi:sugar O-acyltransferase (sialic acid O-acetyltransferase NeuD family)
MMKVLIVGSSGLAKELVCWGFSKLQIIGKVTKTKSEKNKYNLPGIRFSDDEVTPDIAGTENILFGIGSTTIRKKLYKIYKRKGFKFPRLIHPSSIVPSSAKLDEGVIIAPNCVVSPNVSIGILTYINIQCGVGHDTVIGDFNQINPGSQIGGQCTIGNQSLIGSGSTIIQGINVGPNATIASGSVVLVDVFKNSTVIGNPARRIR